MAEENVLSCVGDTERCEILLRTQDGCEYIEFKLPIAVSEASKWNSLWCENVKGGYVLSINDCDMLGVYEEKKHAIHVMNYLLIQRQRYLYENSDGKKCAILYVPTDEIAKQTPEEILLDGLTVNEKGSVAVDD